MTKNMHKNTSLLYAKYTNDYKTDYPKIRQVIRVLKKHISNSSDEDNKKIINNTTILEALETVSNIMSANKMGFYKALNMCLKEGLCNKLDDLTLSEIGFVMGVTKERVRQIESIAFRKIKHPNVARLLHHYVKI